MKSSWKQKMLLLVFTIALVAMSLSGAFALTLTSPDKIAVAAFSVSPNQGVVGGNQVTAQMTITNLCKTCGTLNIPWEITVDGAAITSGTVGLAAGASTTVNKGWTAIAGSHTFSGSIDKSNSLGDGTTSNNVATPFSMSVACKTVTQVLDINRAKSAGANFLNNISSGVFCEEIGVFANAAGAQPNTIIFHALCVSSPGASATPEAFLSFKLKNGWKVKSYNILFDKRQAGEWKFLSPPQIGTDNPYVKVQLSVATLNANVEAQFDVTIEGLECTSPY
jgi:hypothetical protein